MQSSPRELLVKMFEAAIESAQPDHCVPLHLPEPGPGCAASTISMRWQGTA